MQQRVKGCYVINIFQILCLYITQTYICSEKLVVANHYRSFFDDMKQLLESSELNIIQFYNILRLISENFRKFYKETLYKDKFRKKFSISYGKYFP